ncbi:CopG family transcriptional regulator [Providencia rettgeri]|uniref:CopG family transcriptional regulator n=2 Tax=Providencia rettgeri TaxID=587 RepID=A0A264VQ27_PRORE|nr:CopG family transcriptional regulator [Providencia rettgeri]
MLKKEAVVTRSSLNLRIKPEDKILIDRAANAVGKNRTEFVLEAARRAAEETLADLRVINVSPELYQEFINQLDAAPGNNEALRKTMMSKSPWEK